MRVGGRAAIVLGPCTASLAAVVHALMLRVGTLALGALTAAAVTATGPASVAAQDDDLVRLPGTDLLILERPEHRSWSAFAVRVSAVADTGPAYRDPGRSVDERVRDLLGRMTPVEKFWQLYMTPVELADSAQDWSAGAFGFQIPVAPDEGRDAAAIARAHAERINAVQRYFTERTRLGIPVIPFDEALHGLMRPGATSFPQAIGLAATFDTALVGRVARAIAAETRSRGVRQVLSPVVNIAEDVRWGRTEETYGEDPLLSSAMGVAFVRAFEDAGIVATPKHFVANVGAGGRDSYPIHWNERYLAELHFPPFRAAFEDAGARSVMTAYNSVDGAPATQSPWLLTDVLRDEWGFGGFVISDAAATGGATVLHMTEPSTPEAARHAWESGLDVVFQSRWDQHRPYLRAVTDGLVPDSVLDRSAERVLRAKLELGLFENPYVDPDEAARLAGAPEHRALAREAAARSLVLLHNPGGLLPLEVGALGGDRDGGSGAGGRAAVPEGRGATERVAVIGVDAAEVRLGGYSGPGIAPVSILRGLRERLGEEAVVHVPGPGRTAATHVPVPGEWLSVPTDSGSVAGVRGEYFVGLGLQGEADLVRIDEAIDMQWTFNRPGPGIPRDWYAVRWTGAVTAPPGGVARLGVEANDGYRLWLDDRLILDRWFKRSHGARLIEVDLAPGSTHAVRLEYFEPTGDARVKLVWDAGLPLDAGERIAEAAEAARDADVALIVAGLEEGEFRDRASLALPGRQEELIRAVAATGTPVAVVIVGGSAVTMPWLDDVGAVLMAWYPGEQGGRAVADLLLGDVSPAGRLPITFPLAEGQLPLRYNHKPTGRGDHYVDLTGHPLFPFGHGLSYTSFEYSDLTVEPAVTGPDATARVSVRVRNTGTRAGDEVVQLYLQDVLASLARPVMELKGFRRVTLGPGEVREVTFTLGPEELSMLDEDLERVVEPGIFRVLVGASSRDIRLRGEVEVRQAENGRKTP